VGGAACYVEIKRVTYSRPYGYFVDGRSTLVSTEDFLMELFHCTCDPCAVACVKKGTEPVAHSKTIDIWYERTTMGENSVLSWYKK